jgi:hypothetical protein
MDQQEPAPREVPSTAVDDQTEGAPVRSDLRALLTKALPVNSTVLDCCRWWWDDAIVIGIHHALLERALVAAGREPRPTAGIVDCQ